MELLVIRHATAEPHGSPQGDAARALVSKGEVQAERLGRFLRGIKHTPDVTLTSPMVRAFQTAQRLCEAAALEAPLTQAWLACGMDPKTAVRELAAFSDFARVAIVGHEPDLSTLIESLLSTAAGSIEVKKASVTGLQMPAPGGRARLLFHVPSSMQGK